MSPSGTGSFVASSPDFLSEAISVDRLARGTAFDEPDAWFQLEGGGRLTAAANGSTADIGVGGVISRRPPPDIPELRVKPDIPEPGVKEFKEKGLENDREWP